MNEKLLIGAILAVLGVGVLAFTLRVALRGVATYDWARAEATILESGVDREQYDGVWYEASLSYEYEVNGKKYVGRNLRVSPSVVWGWRWFAQRVIARYPIGTRIDVYYSPSDPACAVLERGVNLGWLAGASAVAVVLLAGAWHQLNMVL